MTSMITRSNLRKLIFEILKEEAEEVEREDIVVRVINLLEKDKVTGDGGLIKQIDNQDEFEDLIRYIFNQVGLSNKALGSVAMSIGKDFLENPDSAAQMSKYNF